jgi:hypothetical protein
MWLTMAIESNKATSGWVQLTYTSADSIMGAKGGWGIKETSPGASDALIAQLSEGVTTRILEVEETSQFASDAQLYARPRRLTYREVTGTATLWHAASAGPDATGRPGNVFTHGASLVSFEPGLRPIEYWRSDDWLAPFGAADVTAARLGDLRPGTVITRESVVAFIRQNDRRFSLEWLLAAVSFVSSTGSSMALAVDNPDEGALWLGAISFLTAPALTRRISWVTFERAAGVEEATARGLTVICVPRADLDTLIEAPPAKVLIIDPTWELEEPSRDTWTTTKLGQGFKADRRWQNAMLDVFALEQDHTLRVLAEVDRLTAVMLPADARALPLHWPLSMALLTDGKAAISERDEVIAECLSLGPASILESGVVQPLLEELLASADSELLSRLASEPGGAPAVKDAASIALASAYLADGWRSGAQPPTLSRTGLEKVRAASVRAIDRAIAQAEVDASGSPEQLLNAARVLTFLVSNALDPFPLSDDVPSSVASVVELIKDRNADLPQSELFRLDPSLVRPQSRFVTHVTAPAVPSVVAHAVEQPREPRPPAQVRGSVQPARPARATADAASGIADLLRDAEPGSERAKAIAECLLLAEGYGSRDHVSIMRLDNDRNAALAVASLLVAERPAGMKDLEDGKARADAVWGLAHLHGSLKSSVGGWLAVYWANVDEGSTEVPPGDLLEEIKRNPVPAVQAIADFITGSNPGIAGRLIARAGLARVHPRQQLVLSVAAAGNGLALGWRAVQEAAKAMSQAQFDEVLRQARLDLLDKDPSFVATIESWVAELREVTKQAPARSRTGRIGRGRANGD